MINPREALQEALDKKRGNIHPAIRVGFFVKETEFSYPVGVWIGVIGKEKEYSFEQVVSKAMLNLSFEADLLNRISFVVDAIVKRISFVVQRVLC